MPFFEMQYLTGSFYLFHSFSIIVAQPLSSNVMSMKIPVKIIRNREELIELFEKRLAQWKAKSTIILLIFLICFMCGSIFLAQYFLNEIYSIIGYKIAFPIAAISSIKLILFTFCLVLGAILMRFILSIFVRYNKDDLLIDNSKRIEKLEKEIENLKRHNQEAQ